MSDTRGGAIPPGAGARQAVRLDDPSRRTPIAVAVAPDAAGRAAVAARLGTPVRTIEREGLFAYLTGIETALREPTLPFFLQGDARPGEGGSDELAWIEVAGSQERLREWLGDDASLPVRVVEGEPAVRAIGLGGRELRP